jgi:hypothetical protein
MKRSASAVFADDWVEGQRSADWWLDRPEPGGEP